MALGDNFIPNIEKKTGKTTKEFVALAIENGLGDPTIKPGVRMAWLKKEFGLGHGHAMAMSHAIKTALLKSGKAPGSAPSKAQKGNATSKKPTSRKKTAPTRKKTTTTTKRSKA